MTDKEIQTDVSDIIDNHGESVKEIERLHDIIADLKRQMVEVCKNLGSSNNLCSGNKHHRNDIETLNKNIQVEICSVPDINNKPALNSQGIQTEGRFCRQPTVSRRHRQIQCQKN